MFTPNLALMREEQQPLARRLHNQATADHLVFDNCLVVVGQHILLLIVNASGPVAAVFVDAKGAGQGTDKVAVEWEVGSTQSDEHGAGGLWNNF